MSKTNEELIEETVKELKRNNKNQKDKIWRLETGLTPNQKFKYEKIIKELKLTEDAYNDVCIERDILRKKLKEMGK